MTLGRIGVDFLDRLAGGHQPGKVYGLLGPTGIGKTTLGVQIAVEGAILQSHRYEDARRGMWFVVSLEPKERVRDICDRAWSHLAKIPLAKMRHVASPLDLDGPQVSGAGLSERERFEAAQFILDGHFRVLDLRNPSLFDRAPVEVIAEAVVSDCPIDRAVAGVVIDGFEIAPSSYHERNKLRPALLSAITAESVRKCCRQIAESLNCPVWLVHQLNGSANGRRAGQLQLDRDAMGCRHFGDWLDACCVLGTRDRCTYRFLMHCTKAPSPPTPPNPTVLRYHPDFARLVQDDSHMLDVSRKCIVPRRTSSVDIDERTLQLLDRLGHVADQD